MSHPLMPILSHRETRGGQCEEVYDLARLFEEKAVRLLPPLGEAGLTALDDGKPQYLTPAPTELALASRFPRNR